MKPSAQTETEQTQTYRAPNGEPCWTDSFTCGRIVLLIGIFLFLQYPEVFLGTHSFFNNDFGLFTYPTIHYLRESLLRGEIPLWNPLNDCGVPFLAQWNTCVCYPPAWICVLLPLPWSLNMLCLGHLLLAGCGMYLLAHRWTGDRFASSIAAVAFALNGFTFNCLMWISNMGALGWMPLVILFAERAWHEGGRRTFWAVIVAALQMLSGAPEIVLLTWVVLGTLWIAQCIAGAIQPRISFLRFGSIALVVAALCAVQLLPFLELVRHSDREPSGASIAWSMPSWGFANFLVPLFHSTRSILGPYFQIDQQWTTSFYVGILVIPLAVLGALGARARGDAQPRKSDEHVRSADFGSLSPLKVYLLVAWAILGLLLALGDHSFVYLLARKIVPVIGFIRYPIKFLALTIFALPLLGGFGAARWMNAEGRSFDQRSLLLPGISLVVLLLVIATVLVARIFPYHEEVWAVTARNGAARAAFLLAGTVAFVWIQKEGKLKAIIAVAFLALMATDAVTHVPRQNPTVPAQAYAAIDPGMIPAPSRPGESRAMVSRTAQASLAHAAVPDPKEYYLWQRRSLFEDCNLIGGIPKINGFFSLHVKNQAAINALVYDPMKSPAGLVDFLGVSQISSPTQFWKWDHRISGLPLVTGGQDPIFSRPAVALKALEDPEFDGQKNVYLPEEARKVMADIKTGPVQVSVREFTSRRIRVQASADKPAVLTVAQTSYPAWKAEIDHAPAKIWLANHAFQAIRLPPGSHEVTFTYRDRPFQVGAAISAITGVALLFAYWRTRPEY